MQPSVLSNFDSKELILNKNNKQTTLKALFWEKCTLIWDALYLNGEAVYKVKYCIQPIKQKPESLRMSLSDIKDIVT